MAKNEKTFYLYDYEGVLAKKTKKIYSPYSVKTLGRTPSEDYYAMPDFVEFEKWQHTVKLKELGKTKYDQHIEWLSFYNTTGGQLSKWDPTNNQWHINGRWYKNDWIHIVKEDKIEKKDETKVTTKIKTVEVQQIPATIAKNMNVDQLEELCIEWKVELPENIREWWDVDKIKSSILETMTQAWHIK